MQNHNRSSEISMFKKDFTSGLLILALGLLVGCTSAPYSPATGQPVAIDTSAFAPRVNSFVVILDASSSMTENYQERQKYYIAKDTVASFNSTVPPLGYQAGLVTFGKNTGWCIGKGSATTVYGLTSYQAGGFADGLNSIECAGGTTPMDEGIDATTEALANETGSIAVILVSDFWDVSSGSVEAAVSRMKAAHGDKICLHTIKVGDYAGADSMIASITGNAGCDSAVNASDIAASGAMATYVTDVLLAPLQYEKHTVSATALFDFDKSDLKAQGKAELHNLDENIKSQGIRVTDINVIGHTDSMGSDEYNQALSERRAKAVKEFMASEGVNASIIDVIGVGESQPVAGNDTDEGRALNRRVEIQVGTSRATQ
jgi:OOP family OmpA-OmpF porin